VAEVSLLSLVVAGQLAATPITLEEVREASRQQLDAIRARLDVQRAESNSKSARGVIFPQVDMNLGTGITFVGKLKSYQTVPVTDPATNQIIGFQQQVVDTDPVDQGRFSMGVSVNQLLYDGGRWWSRISQAGSQEEAARGQLEEQQLSSELEAVRRFYELVKAQLTLKVFVETVDRSRQQVDRANALYEAGRGPRSSWYDARTNLANDEINVVRQRQRIAQARLQLLQWIGRPDADVVAVTPEDMGQLPPAFDTAKALEAARTKRPLFRSLAANVRASELGITIARADYFPRISLNANYSRGSPNIEFFVDPLRQHQLSLGANLTWNLFSGFQHVANEERARADLAQSTAVERQSILDLEAEIVRANDAYASEVEVLSIADRNLSVAKEQTALEEERFVAGAGSSLEVRNAQIKYTQSQLSVLQGKADVATARAALERAVGGTP
jgi:outer membrane protein TolC